MGAKPHKLTPANIDRIRVLAGYGYSQKTIANIIGVHPNRISEGKKTNKELAKALTEGKNILKSDLKANLVYLAMEGSKNDNVRLGATVKALDMVDDGKSSNKDSADDDSRLRLEIIKELSS